MKRILTAWRPLREQKWLTLYFALSIFAIMSCEYVTTLKADVLLGGESGHIVYAIYSIAVAVGVCLFYLAGKTKAVQKTYRQALTAVFTAAALLVIVIAFARAPVVFWLAIVGLYLLAGFNTGLASHCLYMRYREQAPVGKILALASLLGLTAHYILCRVLAGSLYLFPMFFATILFAIVGMLFLLLCKIPAAWPDESVREVNTHTNATPKYLTTLIATALGVILISFVIGLSDSLVAQSLPFHIQSDAFFYPVLFYIPGQVMASLLVDIHKGRYVNLATLASAILLMPITFFLESPEELYLNAGFNFFLGGFFLAYIMTGIISIAHQAKNRLLAICAPGMLYPLFCGIGGLCSPYISASMDLIVIITIYSAMIVALAILTFIDLTRRSAIFLSEKSALLSLLSQYRFTERETEVFLLLTQGLSSADIAARLFISEKTVRNHVSNMLAKTGCASRTDLILLAKR